MSQVLPIHKVADQLVDGLRAHGRVVLSAPTGSGKSTQVPQILLESGLIDGEIVVLQPRRLATRLLAKRVAEERGTSLGGEVGYQIRFENRVSSTTRIRFVTEAILLRQILQDSRVSKVGAIVFDEFHERHLTSDLSLASALQSVLSVRPDLKIVVMSATLDIDALESFLKPCVRVEASGRMFPVTVRYMGAALNRDALPVWDRAARAFRTSAESEGDFLIFMPGVYEINRTINALSQIPEIKNFKVYPLHGGLAPEAQDRAVRSSEQRRVIVATNVAETSITIDGVQVVIDGGLARIARFDAKRGINSILVEPISRASAEQRAGRAGRTGPGNCLRLWSEAEHLSRSERDEPEVLRVDLSETLLLLSAAGISDFECFPWYEAPTDESLHRALSLLRNLSALDEADLLTEIGYKMAGFPIHPRYSRMLIAAKSYGVVEEVSLIAALSQGRPVYRVSKDSRIRKEQIRHIEDHVDSGSDFFLQTRAFDWASASKFNPNACVGLGIHALACRQAGEIAKQLKELAARVGLVDGASSGRIGGEEETVETSIAKCLLHGFSDQLAKRIDRGTRRCRMVNQRGGELRRESLVDSDYFVAAELEERALRGDVTVLLGLVTEVRLEWIRHFYPADFKEVTQTLYDPNIRRVVARTELCFRDFVLESKDVGQPDADRAAELLAEQVCNGSLKLKQWDSVVENWIQRLNFVALYCPETEISPIDEEGKRLLVEQICHGAFSYKEIKDRPALSIVQSWISPEQMYYIDTYAPAEFELPRRKRPARIRYEADGRAFIASKLQDFYDVSGDSLKIANGRVALLVELLAPNQRPAHLTDDLDGFWTGAYEHVRKDLAGRYPKHEWR